ncbi:cation-translocating P-type ATPase, partial [Natronospira sp.]
MQEQSIARPHAETKEQVLEALASGNEGLSPDEAARRLDQYGENRLRESQRPSPLRRFLRQFNNVLIYVLLAAGVITVLLGHWLDAAVIFSVVVINALIGFIQEGRAERAMDSIRKLLVTRVRVIRQGESREIDAAELVPGDVVLLESGDRIPADLRILKARGLRADESSLTGESVPVDKGSDSVEGDAVLADRSSMLWSGTLVASGQVRAVVVATGENTELGRIRQATEDVESISTPLLKKIDQFGHQLTVVILTLAALVFILGVFWRDMAAAEMFLAAVSLAVAAIPEGLPAIITITLAMGVQIMARRQAIVRRLPAVETLGSVTVICSDKTGTLTRNEMTVRALATLGGEYPVSGSGYTAEGRLERPGEDDQALDKLLLGGCLCNEAGLERTEEGTRISGDPMEAALLVLAEKAQLDRSHCKREWPRTDAIPFESERRYMATLNHDHHGKGLILVKGAPELLLERCGQALAADGSRQALDVRDWQARQDAFAERGQRTLALAMKSVASDMTTLDESDIDEELILLGLIALEDPPRDEAIQAVADCHRAGIRVKMITGDHLGTALAIGRQLGIGDGQSGMNGKDFQSLDDDAVAEAAMNTDVFARFSPDDKLRLVRGLRSREQVTAMTGDGVNDAPALRSADVGVAMGQKGTAAAREASEIVLADDNFATIATA